MALPYVTSPSLLIHSHLLRPSKGLLHIKKIGWRRVSEQTTQRKTMASGIACVVSSSALISSPPDEVLRTLFISDLDPTTAKLAIGLLGPFLSAFGFLFIIRIVMSWYPKLPVAEFPYVLAYVPTEPFLRFTRKVIPPLGGVDVTPVVWFGLLSFLNEILVGPQGLLRLLSQQV